MSWLILRQQRAEYIGVALLALAIVLFAVGTGVPMRGFEGGLACLSANAAPSCPGQGDFDRAFSWLLNIAGWFNLIPLLVGVFIGGPLVAREIERGTHRLAWTQTITRTRWIGAKLASIVLLAVAAGAVIAGVMTWWRQPFDLVDSAFSGAGFDVEGLMPGVYILFALSLGAAAGAVLRRVLPAMAVTLPAFLAVRLPIEFWLRPHYMPPVTATVGDANPVPRGAWLLDNGLIDASGHPVYASDAGRLCGDHAANLVKGSDACLHAHGIFERVVYQPADRFWPFQLIEAGIFLALSLALLGLTVYWVRRRLR
ncbi:MAG TPA: transporter [Candidatus Dormibacteraeota bacterium]|nr:transporter [Candidatus Dormibacteraeota bacterium]